MPDTINRMPISKEQESNEVQVVEVTEASDDQTAVPISHSDETHRKLKVLHL